MDKTHAHVMNRSRTQRTVTQRFAHNDQPSAPGCKAPFRTPITYTTRQALRVGVKNAERTESQKEKMKMDMGTVTMRLDPPPHTQVTSRATH